jgi:transcription initiation factor TFIIB
MKSPNISEYDLSPYIDELHLSAKTQDRAAAILMDAERAGLTLRKTPESLMAAALYIACILEKERRTQGAIAQVTGVSANTIQTRYKQLVHELKIKSSSS